jgi:endonuclease YncB( thermonuclease family)
MSQPCGVNSKAALAAPVEHIVIDLQPIEQDRYERMVAVVWLEGFNVNEELVRAGMAWAFRRYLRDATYCEAEQSARQHGIGLWAAAHAEVAAPWEWRARQHGQLSEFTDVSRWSMSECIANLEHGRR